MSILKPVYNIFRSIILSLIVLLVVVYVGLYIVLSIPSVQSKVKTKVCEETSKFLGGNLVIESLSIYPFSEVILYGVSLYSPDGENCANIAKVAAGIDLWTLITERNIVLNYAEIIGMDVKVSQSSKDAPLNIQFLINALSPKDKNKPSAKFDLRVRNIVVRDSKASFSRYWMVDERGSKLPFADIDLLKLRMDLSIPVLRNDLYKFTIRNMQFDAVPGVNLRRLTGEVEFVKDPDKKVGDRLKVNNLNIDLPNSSLAIGDVDILLDSIDNIRGKVVGTLTPSDLADLIPELRAFASQWDIDFDAFYKNKGIEVEELSLANNESNSSIIFKGCAKDIDNIDSLNIEVSSLQAELSSILVSRVLTDLNLMRQKEKQIIESLGNISINLEGKLSDGNYADALGYVDTEAGRLDFSAVGKNIKSRLPIISVTADADEIELGKILSTDKIGNVSFSVNAETTGIDKNASGNISLRSGECVVMGNLLSDINIDLTKNKDHIDLTLDGSSQKMELSLDVEAQISGSHSLMNADMLISGLNPSDFGVRGKLSDCNISGRILANTVGNNIDNVTGIAEINDLSIVRTMAINCILRNLS